MRTIALLDGDIASYKIALHCEQETCWDDNNDLWTLHTNLEEARARLDDYVREKKEIIGADEIKVALSCSRKDNFRRKLTPTYKANRDGTRKPLGLPELNKFLTQTWDAVTMAHMEADDLLGYWATHPRYSEDEAVIISIDKDFKSVPCSLFNQDKEELGVQEISEADAHKFHAVQTLIGDTADGYKGCPGVGPVKAEKLLDGLTTWAEFWPVIVGAYEKQGLSEAEALLNARLARIIQYEDIVKGKVKLWKPKLK